MAASVRMFPSARTFLRHSPRRQLSTLPASVDAVVVGGGVVGTSVAYQLQKRGLSTLLLEAHSLTAGTTYTMTTRCISQQQKPLKGVPLKLLLYSTKPMQATAQEGQQLTLMPPRQLAQATRNCPHRRQVTRGGADGEAARARQCCGQLDRLRPDACGGAAIGPATRRDTQRH